MVSERWPRSGCACNCATPHWCTAVSRARPSMPVSAAVDNPSTHSPAFALGLGLTNECNLACDFCYRDTSRVDRLSLDQVRAVMERIPVRSVNLGTGENGLHPEFLPILAYLRAQPIKLTM